jgi:hypothetical protein
MHFYRNRQLKHMTRYSWQHKQNFVRLRNTVYISVKIQTEDSSQSTTIAYCSASLSIADLNNTARIWHHLQKIKLQSTLTWLTSSRSRSLCSFYLRDRRLRLLTISIEPVDCRRQRTVSRPSGGQAQNTDKRIMMCSYLVTFDASLLDNRPDCSLLMHLVTQVNWNLSP